MSKGRHAPQREEIDPNTPLHKLPGDLLLTTARKLGELGFDERLAAVLRQEDDLRTHGLFGRAIQKIREDLDERDRDAADLAVYDREVLARQRARFIHGMFTPPEQQNANVRKWDAAHLKAWADVPIHDWIAKLGPAPEWPSGRLQCVVLELALPDQPETKDAGGNVIPGVPGYIRTVRDLWGIISGQHPNHWKWNQFLLDAEHLFLIDGATYEPGLRWRVLDLGANWDKVNGIVPATVRDPITSPNVDGFAALAHHPQFVCRMNGKTIPFLWSAGFQVTVPGHDPRRNVPIASFRRDDRQVRLCADWDDNRRSDCAVPVRRESK